MWLSPVQGAGPGPQAHPSLPCSGLVRGQTEESMEEVHPHRCARCLTYEAENCSHSCWKDPEFGSIPTEVRQQQDGCAGRSPSSALGMLWPWPSPTLCSPPSPQSWKWVLAPIVLYVFERILRVWRARQKVVVTKVGGAGACACCQLLPALPLVLQLPAGLVGRGHCQSPLPRDRSQVGC